MQNAEKVVKAIREEDSDKLLDYEEAITLIRARDKEIVEACMLIAFMHGNEEEKAVMRTGFLSVLRDLG